MFTNKKLLKEINKNKIKLYISLGIFGIGLIFILSGIIINKTHDKELKYAAVADTSDINHSVYIYSENKPVSLSKKNYYILKVDSKYYIIYSKNKEFTKNEYDTYEFKGKGKEIKKDIKEEAIKYYNKENDINITVDSFNDNFSKICIDTTKKVKVGTGESTIIKGVILCILDLLFVALYFINMLKTNKVLKSLSEEDIKKIETEIENTDLIKGPNVYLTDNYLVSLNPTFDVLNYDNIIWIYPANTKVNYIKTVQNITVMDKNKKTHIIASCTPYKKNNEAFNKVYDEILNKNKQVLSGYTKENEDKAHNLECK